MTTPLKQEISILGFRAVTAALVAPLLAVTGYRFSKDYRWGVCWYHRAVYAVCSTVSANIQANRWAGVA